MEEHLWYKQAVFYEVYVRAFHDSNGDGHGDLRGLIQKLDYFKDLGVDCIWLLPIYPSPLKDDGYDIADYYNILETMARLDDFKALLDESTRAACASSRTWCSTTPPTSIPGSRPPAPAAIHLTAIITSGAIPTRRYPDARIIFLDTEKSNWTWDEQAGQYFWHRFYSSQPDLNYDNPACRKR